MQAELAGGRRHLRTKEPGTDHDGMRRRKQIHAKLLRVVERPQHVQPTKQRLSAQWPRAQAGGNDQTIEADALARVETDRPAVQIQALGPHADPVINRMHRIELARPEREIRRLQATDQYVLGQRRPVIAQVLLAVHEHQLARESFVAQRFGSGQSRHRCAYDDDAIASPQASSMRIASAGQSFAALRTEGSRPFSA